jgi:hypothetical protein
MHQSKEKKFKMLYSLMVVCPEIGYQGAVKVQHIAQEQLYVRNGGAYMAHGIIGGGELSLACPAPGAPHQGVNNT